MCTSCACESCSCCCRCECRYCANTHTDFGPRAEPRFHAHFLCWDCGRGWKRSLKCPECHQDGVRTSRELRVPPRKNIKAWKLLRERFDEEWVLRRTWSIDLKSRRCFDCMYVEKNGVPPPKYKSRDYYRNCPRCGSENFSNDKIAKFKPVIRKIIKVKPFQQDFCERCRPSIQQMEEMGADGPGTHNVSNIRVTTRNDDIAW